MKINIFLSVLFAAVICFAQVSFAQQGKDVKDLIESYNKGNKKISLDIALSYRDGVNGAEKDSLIALTWLDKAFAAGITRAATIAGTIHYTGNGVKPDLAKAEKFYRTAASKGDESAMIRLGKIYYSGVGVKLSYVNAKKWYGSAAKKYEGGKTCSIACKYYADINFFTSSNDPQHKADYSEALKWYKKAFNDGVMEAAPGLAVMTANVWAGVAEKPSKPKARKILLAAAENGYAPAMKNLAEDYEEGTYGKQDLPSAYAWALMMAEINTSSYPQMMAERIEAAMSPKEKTAGEKAFARIKKKLNGVFYQIKDKID